MKEIKTGSAPAAIGPYSQGIIANGFVYVSGQLPIVNGELQTEIKQATRASLQNVSAILAECGGSMSKVVKTTVLLSDMADFAAMNEVYAEFFSAPYPARACFAVKTLPKNALVEIECVAEL